MAAIFGEDEAQKTSNSTGVRQRHIAPEAICTSDLCEAAAQQLLTELAWAKDSIDALIFVSQTPDYLLPASSCSLHGRLGLSKRCAAFDLNLGCSGYVYGLWVASQLMASGLHRVLLLVGDTISRIVSPSDRSAAPLFGDAGTATALERCDTETPWVFELGTNGSGQEHLIVPAGGFRYPRTDVTAVRTEREGGNIRSDEDLFMDGAEIFAFSLTEVPRLFAQVLAEAGWTAENTDRFIMHQANQFMLKHLAKRMKLPTEKVVLALEEFGNTSSASIPLAMTHSLAVELREDSLRLLLAGFGVGLSWGAVALSCGPMIMPDLVIVDAVAR
jgi:3-oxoacyl-[acyl-carrier-protein] synthase-3